MSKFTHLTPAYAIATGDHDFEPMKVGDRNLVAVELLGLDTADASIELHQSIDGTAWGLVPDSKKILAAGQESHQWNIVGIVAESFIRVGLKKGSAAAGTINAIKMLSNG